MSQLFYSFAKTFWSCSLCEYSLQSKRFLDDLNTCKGNSSAGRNSRVGLENVVPKRAKTATRKLTLNCLKSSKNDGE